MQPFISAYIETFEKGGLKEKIDALYGVLNSCTLCPRKCEVNRLAGQTGVCKTVDKAVVTSHHPHFGEESPLVGKYGSGTIFFTHCNLLCLFCQNFDISHEGQGYEVSSIQLAEMMLDLQNSGCHNINFVTPTHVIPMILKALEIAISGGLTVPLVYNSSGYDSVKTLKLLEGVFDIYMPDFKFWESKFGESCCEAGDYRDIACRSLLEMNRQVGDLITNESGVATRGLLIRHLLMPGRVANDTKFILNFIAREISPNSYVNVMGQYRPCGRSSRLNGLNRSISPKELNDAFKLAKEAGLHRLDNKRHKFMVW